MAFNSNSPLAPSLPDLKIAGIIDEIVSNEVSASEKEVALHNTKMLLEEMGISLEDEVDYSAESHFEKPDDAQIKEDQYIQNQAKLTGGNLDATFQQFERTRQPQNFEQQDNLQTHKKIPFSALKTVAKEGAKIKVKLPENFARLDKKSKTEILFAGYFSKTVSELQPISKGAIDVARHFYDQDIEENSNEYQSSYTSAGKVGKFINTVQSKQKRKRSFSGEQDLAILGNEMSMQQKIILGATAMAAIASAEKAEQRVRANNQFTEDQLPESSPPLPPILNAPPPSLPSTQSSDEQKDGDEYRKKAREMQEAQQKMQQAQFAQQQAQQQANIIQQRKKRKGGILSGMTTKAAIGIGGGAGILAWLGFDSDSGEKTEKIIDPSGTVSFIYDKADLLIEKIHHFPLDDFLNLFC